MIAEPEAGSLDVAAWRELLGDTVVTDTGAGLSAGGKPRLVFHGTENYVGVHPVMFYTESKAEAHAYTEITDTDSDRSLRYETPGELPATVRIPGHVDWMTGDSWPDYFDYVGEPFAIAVNGNDNRFFFWDGTMNPVGDKNIVVVSGVIADDKGAVIYGPTDDCEALTPRVLDRRVIAAYLAIQRPLVLPWDEANLLGRRLGAKADAVAAQVAAWKAQGYDGIVTTSDDGELLHGRKIRQFVPFDPSQVCVAEVKRLDLVAERNRKI